MRSRAHLRRPHEDAERPGVRPRRPAERESRRGRRVPPRTPCWKKKRLKKSTRFGGNSTLEKKVEESKERQGKKRFLKMHSDHSPQLTNIYHQETEPWYAGRVYSRYWKHYSHAMQWLYRHKRAYRMAMASLYYPPWYLAETFQASRYANWEGESSRTITYTGSQKQSHRPCPCLKVSSSKNKESDKEQEAAASTDSEEGGIECDMSNTEITEELRQYFAQTEKHQKELKRQQQLEEEMQIQYVDAGHDLHVPTKRSTQPPSERPGERRRIEMKKLYGEDAAKIERMETAIQPNFDRIAIRSSPSTGQSSH